uniref:Uncharacterized protein n=1 Tax=viral metagenome TaxID=1070528 RepID=A0A6M3LBU2_9ZZZZ
MKIRIGFVSNSSTTSFLIYGTVLQDKDESDYKQMRDCGLISVCGNPNWDSTQYLGASWDTVGDDETGKEFKERVEKSIKKVLGREVECQTYEEAYYDG